MKVGFPQETQGAKELVFAGSSMVATGLAAVTIQAVVTGTIDAIKH